MASGIFCMIGRQSSAPDSDLFFERESWNHYGYRRVLPI